MSACLNGFCGSPQGKEGAKHVGEGVDGISYDLLYNIHILHSFILPFASLVPLKPAQKPLSCSFGSKLMFFGVWKVTCFKNLLVVELHSRGTVLFP